MDAKETITMLTWINQTDPRVMLNQASVERWQYALRPYEYAVCKQAVLEHYKLHEDFPASSAAIAKRAGYIRSSREAGQRASAIEPSPTPSQQNAQDGNLIRSWRQRNPEEWDRLVKQGAADRRADLEARGLPSHFPGRAA